MGVVLPLMLILIIGYGMSLDVENVPTAAVLEDTSLREAAFHQAMRTYAFAGLDALKKP